MTVLWVTHSRNLIVKLGEGGVAGKAGGVKCLFSLLVVRSQLWKGRYTCCTDAKSVGDAELGCHIQTSPLPTERGFSNAAHLASALAYGWDWMCPVKDDRFTPILQAQASFRALFTSTTHQLPYSPLLPQAWQPLLSPSQDQLKSLLCSFP